MAYFHSSSPYYHYPINTTTPSSTPVPYSSSATLPSYTHVQQPQTFYSPLPNFPTYITQPQPHNITQPHPHLASTTTPFTSYTPFYHQTHKITTPHCHDVIPNPTPMTPQAATIPNVEIHQKIPIFYGSEDAYWWIICSEKFFNNRRWSLSDAEKILESSFAMRGSALTWWLSWYSTHPKPSWNSFTCGLLRQFKPEWRPLLPIDGEEEDEEIGQTVETQESITDVSIVDEKGFPGTIDLSEPEINETNESQGDFSHTVDTNSQVDEEEKKLVPDLFSISDSYGYALKRREKSFSANTSPSIVKMIVRAVAVSNTPLHFNTLFDLGGTHLLTTLSLPEPLDWTHDTVAITPPPPEPPDCKHVMINGSACQVLVEMPQMISVCYNSLFVGYTKTGMLDGKLLLSCEFVSKCWAVVMMQVVYEIFEFRRLNYGCGFVSCVYEMSKMLMGCSNSLFCLSITTGRMNEKVLLSCAFLSTYCVVVVKEFIYEVFDLLRWVCAIGFVYGVVMFKKKDTTLGLRFVVLNEFEPMFLHKWKMVEPIHQLLTQWEAFAMSEEMWKNTSKFPLLHYVIGWSSVSQIPTPISLDLFFQGSCNMNACSSCGIYPNFNVHFSDAERYFIHLTSVSDRRNFFSGSVKVVPFSGGPASTFPWVSWSHKCSVTNRDINVFNPDGDEHRIHSPAISGNSYCTAPLLVPWDRGKIESCSILLPATVLFPVRGAICGWPWVPWFRKHSVTNGGFDVFDPGGNKCVYQSSAMIDGDNRHTLSIVATMGQREVYSGME